MKLSIIVCLFFIAVSCQKPQEKLPYLGNPVVEGKDTIYPKISDFKFINQDSVVVTQQTFANKIYVADFIFLSCPTICPRMNTQLKLVYDVYKDNPNILFLSHTIDPERDTVDKLKLFSQSKGVSDKWHFVTGNRDSIYSIATNSYFATAYKDSKEPGGYVHSGGFLLVDKNKHIRGVYDGTNPEETKRLISDIKILLNE
jgi:protein SCO1/2